ncbi:tumor necrosis factor ligand superfamily member 9 [Choloepus didactylus]|uniref:tumor necrosis factor ligand superfamily member 9 n=1 Tax=Choloepus didactylus TaxID=27675 RepID=UPI00189FCC71|nr:tumor necrosis factor ligand superfamily member 9 [Choloepus didactylus]
MRPSTDSTLDPEAPRPPASPSRACRPLDWALGAALLLLAGACAATCAARFWAAPGAPALPVPASSPRFRELPRVQPDGPDGPQGGFAQLVASDVLLKDGPLHWYSDSGLAGVSLAPGLRYDKGTQELVVAAAGVYYVFLRLELQRVLVGGASGSVSAALHLQQPPAGAAALAVTVALPPHSTVEDAHLVVGSRGRLLLLGTGQRLSVHLRASAAASSAWQLAQGATTLGLFRVAAGDPSGLPAPRPT